MRPNVALRYFGLLVVVRAPLFKLPSCGWCPLAELRRQRTVPRPGPCFRMCSSYLDALGAAWCTSQLRTCSHPRALLWVSVCLESRRLGSTQLKFGTFLCLLVQALTPGGGARPPAVRTGSMNEPNDFERTSTFRHVLHVERTMKGTLTP